MSYSRQTCPCSLGRVPLPAVTCTARRTTGGGAARNGLTPGAVPVAGAGEAAAAGTTALLAPDVAGRQAGSGTGLDWAQDWVVMTERMNAAEMDRAHMLEAS